MSSTTEPPIIDVETLQASIDLQMSLLGEQVNASLESTLKNSKSRRSVSKSNALDTERKLQEYLKRPPRQVCSLIYHQNLSRHLLNDSDLLLEPYENYRCFVSTGLVSGLQYPNLVWQLEKKPS